MGNIESMKEIMDNEIGKLKSKEKVKINNKERMNIKKSIERVKKTFKFILRNDELWNIFTFIVIFITMLALSKGNIYGITDSVIYSFSLASLLLSISQVIPLGFSRVFYLLGNLVLILGGGINIEYINMLKIIIDDKSLLILSMIVVFFGFLVNKFKTMDEINRKKEKINNISYYFGIIEKCHNEDNEYRTNKSMKLIELISKHGSIEDLKDYEAIMTDIKDENLMFELNIDELKSVIIKEVE